MTAYLIFLAFLLLLVSLEMFLFKNKKMRLLLVVLSILPFIFIASFKGLSVGTDTKVYYEIFESMASSNFPLKSDFLFYSMTWIIRKITSNFNIYLLIMYLIAGTVLGLFAFMSVEKPVFLISLIFNFGYLNLSISALRQAISIPLFALSIIMYLKLPGKKKYFSLIVAACAILFHTSSIIAYVITIPVLFISSKTTLCKIGTFYLTLSIFSPQLYILIYQIGSKVNSNFYYYFPDSSNTIKSLILFLLIILYLLFLTSDYKFFSNIKLKIIEKIPSINCYAFNKIESKENNYSLIALTLPLLLIAFLGYSGIVFARLIITALPLFVIAIVKIITNSKNKTINLFNSIIFILGSSCYFIVAALINNPLEIVPFVL